MVSLPTLRRNVFLLRDRLFRGKTHRGLKSIPPFLLVDAALKGRSSTVVLVARLRRREIWNGSALVDAGCEGPTLTRNVLAACSDARMEPWSAGRSIVVRCIAAIFFGSANRP